ncbi:Zn-dependent carboxypeptidase [Alteracholeplasma palmae J233]|uniref:Metal-dependent carboxypeptidase n=1 Tax=Alteracholeplasma palmae (strain ATCC 49389 / J233) TaxID=1318466 RepID=U4KRG6_ALTPJ|nr:carboxypeptidase M32 [Alteracholeplasma palmae]CCV64146.1 Zn-dependent carboxypeptidase [Alteracholeplasma palmae J233]
MENYIKIYNDTKNKIRAYKYALWLISWDQETESPKKAIDYMSEQVSILSEELYNVESSIDYINAVTKLFENKEKLDEILALEIKKVYKSLDIVKKVPKEELLEYQKLQSKSATIWAHAKENDDFEYFLPTLEKIIEFNRKLTKYLETDELKGYDVLLDMYEEGMGVKEYDYFFDELKENLVPFVLNATQKKTKVSKKLTKGKFDAIRQKEFSEYITKVFAFDLEKGVLKESIHPFTSNVTSTDVRITTAYKENLLESSVFSTIHEIGHAIYEQQVDPKFDGTVLGAGASMGIHESQSRMYENMIARSYAFWELHYPKLQSIFKKELKGVSLLEFYQYVNIAKRSLIRTEADELTYPLHIMVRYELEKQLINGKLKVKDLPKKWRQYMSEYVGVRPKNDAEGVLQDIHWSQGSIGYFPTYALGSAYAAQIYHAMNSEINVESAIENNNITLINQWLKTHIHQYGASKTPKELMLLATQDKFDPKYYIEYLKRKFSY